MAFDKWLRRQQNNHKLIKDNIDQLFTYVFQMNLKSQLALQLIFASPLYILQTSWIWRYQEVFLVCQGFPIWPVLIYLHFGLEFDLNYAVYFSIKKIQLSNIFIFWFCLWPVLCSLLQHKKIQLSRTICWLVRTR